MRENTENYYIPRIMHFNCDILLQNILSEMLTSTQITFIVSINLFYCLLLLNVFITVYVALST